MSWPTRTLPPFTIKHNMNDVIADVKTVLKAGPMNPSVVAGRLTHKPWLVEEIRDAIFILINQGEAEINQDWLVELNERPRPTRKRL